jgi:hypothetical protein
MTIPARDHFLSVDRRCAASVAKIIYLNLRKPCLADPPKVSVPAPWVCTSIFSANTSGNRVSCADAWNHIDDRKASPGLSGRRKRLNNRCLETSVSPGRCASAWPNRTSPPDIPHCAGRQIEKRNVRRQSSALGWIKPGVDRLSTLHRLGKLAAAPCWSFPRKAPEGRPGCCEPEDSPRADQRAPSSLCLLKSSNRRVPRSEVCATRAILAALRASAAMDEKISNCTVAESSLEAANEKLICVSAAGSSIGAVA